MQKLIIFILVVVCTINLKAEGPRSNRISNINYKSLKLYIKVLEHIQNSDYYFAQIEIVNTGSSTISLWEDVNDYSSIFVFTAGGIWFVNKYQSYKENKANLSTQKVILRKVFIFPHAKYKIKAPFHIYNKKIFLKSNKNLKVVFLYKDANLTYSEDESCPRIISENTIEYKW